MKDLVCEFCWKECKNKNSLAQHSIRCPKNPEKLNMDFSKSEKSIKFRKSPEQRNILQKNANLKYWIFIEKFKNCKKCEKEFSYREREKINKHSDFCSRHCANSRLKTEEQKLALKLIFKNKNTKEDWFCEICDCKAMTFLLHKKWVCKTCKLVKANCVSCWREISKNLDSKRKMYCSTACHMNHDKNYCKKVWNKISETRKKKFVEGTLYVHSNGWRTKWYNYNKDWTIIRIQGSYEYRLCLILDKMVENKEILNWDYTKDRIPYLNEIGERHYYLLDFKVFNRDWTFYYLESKGYEKPVDKYKWKAVMDLWFELNIYFLADIEKLENDLWINDNVWKEKLKEQW